MSNDHSSLEPSDKGFFVPSDANRERLDEPAIGTILTFAPEADPEETARGIVAAAVEQMN